MQGQGGNGDVKKRSALLIPAASEALAQLQEKIEQDLRDNDRPFTRKFFALAEQAVAQRGSNLYPK
jgi:hypothetical protein